jgi:hypothetical protein
MLRDKLGPEYLAKVETSQNQRQASDDLKQVFPFFEPLRNIGAIYAAFGCWDGYREAVAHAHDKSPERDLCLIEAKSCCTDDEPVVPPIKKSAYRRPKSRTRAEVRQDFLALPKHEFQTCKQDAREWLQGFLASNPDATRRGINYSQKYNRHFLFLKTVDEEYYLKSVPNISALSESEVERRVQHIYSRREFMVKNFPWIRLTKRVLTEHLPRDIERCSSGERFAATLRDCKDTTRSYHERLVPILCRWVRSIYPDSYYTDEAVYRNANQEICIRQIVTVKKLLQTSGQLATAHPCRFLGRKPSNSGY